METRSAQLERETEEIRRQLTGTLEELRGRMTLGISSTNWSTILKSARQANSSAT
jgi:hypothetical protein